MPDYSYNTEKALALWEKRLSNLLDNGDDENYFGKNYSPEEKETYIRKRIAQVKADQNGET